jgi:hypothetical protein
MQEIFTEIISSPLTWTVIGVAVKTFCPGFIPFLGAGRKLVNELVELHNQRATRNQTIVVQAHSSGLKKAASELEKRFGVRG